MEGVLQSIINLKGIEAKFIKHKNTNSYGERIISDIKSISEELSANRQKYDLADDDSLIDSYIYQEMALKAKYSYLLKLAKENNVQYDGIYIKEG